LLLLCFGLVWFIRHEEKRLKLDQNLANRYRYHAIPVALSQMYQGKSHDYTAWRNLALRFQDAQRSIQELIEENSHKRDDLGKNVYYWTADDRGLSDYVVLAFTIFGPSVESLSRFYYLLLAIGLALYFLGHWRDPAGLMLVVLYLAGVFVLVRFFHVRELVSASHGDIWKEPIGLFDSRLFDILSFPAFLHLALVCWKRVKLNGLEIVSSIGQGVLLLFLLHARSSLGWQYLALGTLAVCLAARSVWCAYFRTGMGAPYISRAALVIAVLAVSVISLRAYKQRVYPEEYLAEAGDRTFWHNALMGFAYHPRLREKYGFQVDDARVVDIALQWLKARSDPRLRPEWNTHAILCSLGGYGTFDWPTYESVCRDIYQEVWRENPGRAFTSYAFYKPYDVLRQSGKALLLNLKRGALAPLLAVAAVVGLGGILASVGATGKIDFHSHFKGICFLFPFAMIPSVAFYASLTTFGCACILGMMALALPFGRCAKNIWQKLRFGKNGYGSLSDVGLTGNAKLFAADDERTAA